MRVRGLEWAVRPFAGAFVAITLAACAAPAPQPPPPTLVERGREIFFNETFGGNGRTCSTCHRAEDNFGLSPAFIATLPPNDPLFVAETQPALANGFEHPHQLRANGLITENQDGFEDLEHKFNLRGVPHTLALRTSVASSTGPHTGWGGDGAPGDHTLRSFAVGAIIQHFPKTTNRVAGVDFRMPTEEELDALEAFMLSLGRQGDLTLPLALNDERVQRGQTLFMDNNVARCNVCHFNAGANANPAVFGPNAGNRNFNTGVEDLPDLPSHVLNDPTPPRDDGMGIPGDGTFNTPPLVEAADTAPFFHNNARATLEQAVAFYNSDAFNNSPAGRAGHISLTNQQVNDIAAFLRALNALENIRESDAYIRTAIDQGYQHGDESLRLAREEIQDAMAVLTAVNLYPEAVADLSQAMRSAAPSQTQRYQQDLQLALEALQRARGRILASAPAGATSPG
jgi:mono/diheme cytochrome c family protein